MEDVEWGKRLLDYLDDTITNIVPGASTGWEDKEPCTLRGVDLDLENVRWQRLRKKGFDALKKGYTSLIKTFLGHSRPSCRPSAPCTIPLS